MGRRRNDAAMLAAFGSRNELDCCLAGFGLQKLVKFLNTNRMVAG